MIKFFFISILIILLPKFFYSQEFCKHTVSLELGGITSIYSVNYNYFNQLNKNNFYWSATAGFSNFRTNYVGITKFPMQMTLLYGKDNFYLEAGLNYMGGWWLKKSLMPNYYKKWGWVFWENYLFPLTGVRYQQKNGGLFLKAHINYIIGSRFDIYVYRTSVDLINPVVNNYASRKWGVFPGVSVGYTFKNRNREVHVSNILN